MTPSVGDHVVIELIDARGQAETLAFDLVPAEAADIDRGLLGANTPLAQAILGRKAGGSIPYAMGDVRQLRILSVGPSQRQELEDARAKREAAMQKAAEAIARTNAEMFAASFSGKWGDYDPAGMAGWENTREDA
ncbi:MAG: hypothetical protein K1X65_23945 [Caldilineales bacterium]|nr:hypothetical protein [Caldilineales bacterium]MCW5860588.1 GreA/GreB family elongation factor [Caldilineales bacterium]